MEKNNRIEEKRNMEMIKKIYELLWGDLIKLPLPGGSSIGLSLLVLILIPSGI